MQIDKLDVEATISAIKSLSAEDQRALVDRLKNVVPAIDHVAAAAEATKKRLAKISAMRSEPSAAFRLVDGMRGRAGIAIEDVVDIRTFDRIAASAPRLSSNDRMTAKTFLFRLGLLAD